MKLNALAALAFGAFLAVATPAAAAVIHVTHVFDPAKLGSFEALASPFTAGVGDTVEFDVTFLGGSLGLANDSYLGLVALADGGPAGIIGDYQWTFTAPYTNLLPGRQSWTTMEPDYLGVFLFSGEYLATSGPFSFSGIRLTIDLVSLYDLDTNFDGTPDTASTDPRTYSSIAFITNGNAVPETATWLMLIAGIGMTGWALRARRKPASIHV